mmetsp:Transcript_5047/g.9008  ORF Transcript_5047/g.9008 Transcript_5047/m.9008 type:complete len:275 (-) Transcript_5047:2100-2924(-)
MATATKNKLTAVVTGANRGIGLEIARALRKDAQVGTVVLAVRKAEQGKAAAEELAKEGEGANLEVAVLDLGNTQSMKAFVADVEKRFPNVDVLVNNAGIAKDFSQKHAAETFKVNVYNTLKLTEAMVPVLSNSPNARVVTVSSDLGVSAFQECSKEVQQRWRDAFTLDQVLKESQAFVDVAEKSQATQHGYKAGSYSMSKLAVIAFTRALASIHPKVTFTTCSPGWCKTDMGSQNAPRTAAQGAEVPSWLAVTSKPSQSGQFFLISKEVHDVLG